jgi:2-iminobutanoate/2-iminopropanoate deaminase
MTDAIERRNVPWLPEPSFPGSHLVMDAHHVFLSGLVAADLPGVDGRVLGNLAAETRHILAAIARILESVGSGLDRVLRVDVHLRDLGDIAVMDSVYREFFAAGQLPARTCVEVSGLCGGGLIEITVQAARGR